MTRLTPPLFPQRLDYPRLCSRKYFQGHSSEKLRP